MIQLSSVGRLTRFESVRVPYVSAQMKQLKKNLSYLFKWAPSAFSRFKELTEMATYLELLHFNPNCLTSTHFHCSAICLQLVNDINNTQSKGFYTEVGLARIVDAFALKASCPISLHTLRVPLATLAI